MLVLLNRGADPEFASMRPSLSRGKMELSGLSSVVAGMLQ